MVLGELNQEAEGFWESHGPRLAESRWIRALAVSSSAFVPSLTGCGIGLTSRRACNFSSRPIGSMAKKQPVELFLISHIIRLVIAVGRQNKADRRFTEIC